MCGPPPPPVGDSRDAYAALSNSCVSSRSQGNGTSGRQNGNSGELEDAALAALTTLCKAAEAEQQSEEPAAPVRENPAPVPQRAIPYTLSSQSTLDQPGRSAFEAGEAGANSQKLESVDIQRFSLKSAKKSTLASGAMKAKHGIGCWRLKVDGDAPDEGSWVLSDGTHTCTTQEFFGTHTPP